MLVSKTKRFDTKVHYTGPGPADYKRRDAALQERGFSTAAVSAAFQSKVRAVQVLQQLHSSAMSWPLHDPMHVDMVAHAHASHHDDPQSLPNMLGIYTGCISRRAHACGTQPCHAEERHAHMRHMHRPRNPCALTEHGTTQGRERRVHAWTRDL